MKNKLKVLISIMLFATMGFNFNPIPTAKEREEKSNSFALVDRLRGGSPINQFLLIRKGVSFCALKFSSFKKLEHKLGACERGSPMELYGEYDWYFTNNNKVRFTESDAEVGKGRVDYLPSRALGSNSIHFVMEFGSKNNIIECGDFTLSWMFPNGFQNINEEGIAKYPNLEYAPTRWKNIEDVDFNDPSIIWYGPNSNISNEWIHVDDLPPKNLKK